MDRKEAAEGQLGGLLFASSIIAYRIAICIGASVQPSKGFNGSLDPIAYPIWAGIVPPERN
jgi:hypothetical protein